MYCTLTWLISDVQVDLIIWVWIDKQPEWTEAKFGVLDFLSFS